MAHGEQLIITECPYCDYASQYPGKVKKHLTDEHPLQKMATGMKRKQMMCVSSELLFEVHRPFKPIDYHRNKMEKEKMLNR